MTVIRGHVFSAHYAECAQQMLFGRIEYDSLLLLQNVSVITHFKYQYSQSLVFMSRNQISYFVYRCLTTETGNYVNENNFIAHLDEDIIGDTPP